MCLILLQSDLNDSLYVLVAWKFSYTSEETTVNAGSEREHGDITTQILDLLVYHHLMRETLSIRNYTTLPTVGIMPRIVAILILDFSNNVTKIIFY